MERALQHSALHSCQPTNRTQKNKKLGIFSGKCFVFTHWFCHIYPFTFVVSSNITRLEFRTVPNASHTDLCSVPFHVTQYIVQIIFTITAFPLHCVCSIICLIQLLKRQKGSQCHKDDRLLAGYLAFSRPTVPFSLHPQPK